MGLHASNTGELIFENCRVPAENMLGPEEGDKLFLKTLDGGRIGIAAMALRLARRRTRPHRRTPRSGSSSTVRSARSRAWRSRSPTWRRGSMPRGS